MAEAGISVTDTATGSKIPVDGVIVASAAGNPTTGQAIRQGMAIGDGAGGAVFASVETQAPGTSDPALITRGFVTLEDFTVAMKQLINAIKTPEYIEPATGRARVTVDGWSGAVIVSSITNMTNLNNIANVDVKQTMMFPLDTIAWADAVRGRIV